MKTPRFTGFERGNIIAIAALLFVLSLGILVVSECTNWGTAWWLGRQDFKKESFSDRERDFLLNLAEIPNNDCEVEYMVLHHVRDSSVTIKYRILGKGIEKWIARLGASAITEDEFASARERLLECLPRATRKNIDVRRIYRVSWNKSLYICDSPLDGTAIYFQLDDDSSGLFDEIWKMVE